MVFKKENFGLLKDSLMENFKYNNYWGFINNELTTIYQLA